MRPFKLAVTRCDNQPGFIPPILSFPLFALFALFGEEFPASHEARDLVPGMRAPSEGNRELCVGIGCSFSLQIPEILSYNSSVSGPGLRRGKKRTIP